LAAQLSFEPIGEMVAAFDDKIKLIGAEILDMGVLIGGGKGTVEVPLLVGEAGKGRSQPGILARSLDGEGGKHGCEGLRMAVSTRYTNREEAGHVLRRINHDKVGIAAPVVMQRHRFFAI